MRTGAGTRGLPPLRRLWGTAAPSLYLLVMLAVFVAAYHAYVAGERAATAARAIRALRVLQLDLDRLEATATREWHRDGKRERTAALTASAEAQVGSFLARDAACLAIWRDAQEKAGDAAVAARAAALVRLEAQTSAPGPGPVRSSLEPNVVRARSLLAEARSGLERLEAHCATRYTADARSARTGGPFLLCGIAACIALLWHQQRAEGQRRRHLEGTRLVEDMLEAYSRRLESMNLQLEQVNLLKTQFLANTSHELLTPLNGMMGSLDVIRSGACTAPGEEREWVEQAYQSAEKLHGLIRDLLDLCRLEEGTFALHCRPLEFGPLLERELARHRAAMAERSLVLLVTAPPEGWPRVHTDPERLTQVLHHLLTNALKFTEAGSIRLTGRPEGEGAPALRIEVADTGVGIAPEKIPEVFEMFSQADASNTRRFGGTGLGLTLTRHLVRGMGGKIGIESEGLGRGTRVWFTMPLVAANAAPSPDTRILAATQSDATCRPLPVHPGHTTSPGDAGPSITSQAA